MAISSSGFFGTVDQDDFSRIDPGGDGIVGSLPGATSLRVDRVAGQTRRVSVQPGTARAPGVRSTSDAVVTYDFPANASGSPRLDWLVLRWSWSASPGTAALVHVQGTPGANPARPALVQTAGVQWDLPLALVRIDAGVGALPADAVQDARYWAQPGVSAVQTRAVDPPHRAGRLLFVVDTKQLFASDGAAWTLQNAARTNGTVTASPGWENYGADELPIAAVGFTDGRVTLRGKIKRTSAAGALTVDPEGDQIGTVQAGFRPTKTASFAARTKIGVLSVDVLANGQLIVRRDEGPAAMPGGTGFVSLDGISYHTS